MPTYICTIAPKRFSESQRSSAVDAITRIHSEEGKAPSYLVHCVFNEIAPGDRYINRRKCSADDVWIHGHIRAGRTDEQKSAMARRVTVECAAALEVDSSYVWVYISDLAAASEFGNLLPAPGQERDWYAALPRDVKDRYGLEE